MKYGTKDQAVKEFRDAAVTLLDELGKIPLSQPAEDAFHELIATQENIDAHYGYEDTDESQD